MPPFLAPPTFEEGRRFRAVNARIERSFDPPSDKTARTKVARRTGYFLACAALLFLLCDSLSRLHAQLLSAGGERPSNELSAAFGSHSGQFFVHNVYNRAERSPFLSILEADPNYIRLDAMLLPVSCERIKQTLWRALGITGQWAGRIYVVIHQASSGEDLITITSERFLDGWRYRIELPSLIERSRYVHAMVQVILLEFANRKASDRSAEIPDWLSEGCCQQMLGATNSELEILLPPPQAGAGGMRVTSTTVNAHLSNRLEDAHQRLLSSSPLTFQQLSWPTQEQFSEEAGAVYRGSAQLLVADLLDLKDGPACLRAMLAELPKYYNWQFAFLHAFRAHFDRPLDVEKWWALQIVHFTGRDLAQTWAPDESWHKLDEIVRSAVLVRAGTNELPMQAEVKLQTIIREWDGPRQVQALRSKLAELNALRLRIAPELVPIVDNYRVAIETYLHNREHRGLPLGFGKKANLRQSVQTAISELDSFDTKRAGLGVLFTTSSTGQAGNPAPVLHP
jgi:hypothetical protein